MAAAYKASNQNNQLARRGEKPQWGGQDGETLDAIAATADKLAGEDEKAAEYHTLRGKGLQG